MRPSHLATPRIPPCRGEFRECDTACESPTHATHAEKQRRKVRIFFLHQSTSHPVDGTAVSRRIRPERCGDAPPEPPGDSRHRCLTQPPPPRRLAASAPPRRLLLLLLQQRTVSVFIVPYLAPCDDVAAHFVDPDRDKICQAG